MTHYKELDWENNLDEMVEEVDDDNFERPPLVGNIKYKLEGLHDIDWGKTSDAYGDGTLTPYYIEGLASDNEGDRQFSSYGLYSATTHQGSVYTASKEAIPFLVELLKAEKEESDMFACHFLSRIAIGESHFIKTPEDVEFSKSEYYKNVFAYKEQILDFYKATDSEEAMRLLCFMPDMLPDYLDLSVKTDEKLAYIRQASNIIAQGFLANERCLSEHLPQVRALMNESQSLLVRGAAAICRACSCDTDEDVLELLLYLAQQELNVIWCWDYDFHDMAKEAWFYAVETEHLLDMTCPFEEERIVHLTHRLFPYREDKKYTLHSAESLSESQRKLLKLLVDKAPTLPGGYQLDGADVPDNLQGIMRLLAPSGALCQEIYGRLLWHTLEMYFNDSCDKEEALSALRQTNSLLVLAEVFTPRKKDTIEEHCTLSRHIDCLDYEAVAQAHSKIMRLFAEVVDIEQALPFLDEWLDKTKEYDGYDFSFKTPAQRIGTCLLALSRTGRFPLKYEPLVRPYHRYARFSTIPLDILTEILKSTSEEHQRKIQKEIMEDK